MTPLFNDKLLVLLHILISATIIYILLIVFIRLMGKRTTSQMNSFDWIVTVAIGSIVATTSLQSSIRVLEGVFAIFVLMGLQYCITNLTLYYPFWRDFIRSTPKLLMFDGRFLEENMKKERIVKSEAYAAMRERGVTDIKDVYAMVLETDANLSVIRKDEKNSFMILAGVNGLPEHLSEKIKTAEKSGKLYQD